MKSSSFSKNRQERLKRVQKSLSLSSFDACIISHPVDLFYFTGLQLSAGKLLIHPKGAELFVDRRYLQIAQERGGVSAALETAENLSAFLEDAKRKNLSFDSRHVSYFQFEQFKELFAQCHLIPEVEFFREMRMIKDPDELLALRKSARLLWKGYSYLRTILKPGISEVQAAKAFEIFCLKEGADALAFEPIIAFGPNSAMPHHRASGGKLKKGDPVLIDIGVIVQKYHSDMTRTILPAKCDPELKRLYTIVMEAYREAIALCRPGVKIGQVDDAAREVMQRFGVEDHFLHSLGHGLGLEIHEFPVIRKVGKDREFVLKEGMVITIEPGLYLSGIGGVRYEDTLVITKTGHSNFYPKKT